MAFSTHLKTLLLQQRRESNGSGEVLPDLCSYGRAFRGRDVDGDDLFWLDVLSDDCLALLAE
jgi:hypothetical protein